MKNFFLFPFSFFLIGLSIAHADLPLTAPVDTNAEAGVMADINGNLASTPDLTGDSYTATNYNGGYSNTVTIAAAKVLIASTNFATGAGFQLYQDGHFWSENADGTVLQTGTNGTLSITRTNLSLLFSNWNLTITSNGIPFGTITASNLIGNLSTNNVVGLPSFLTLLSTNYVGSLNFGTNWAYTNLVSMLNAMAANGTFSNISADFLTFTNAGMQAKSYLQFVPSLDGANPFRLGPTNNAVSINYSGAACGGFGIIGGDSNQVKMLSSVASDFYVFGGYSNNILEQASGSGQCEIIGGDGNTLNISDTSWGDMILNSYGSKITGNAVGSTCWNAIINGFNSQIGFNNGGFTICTNDLVVGPNVVDTNINNFVFNATPNPILTTNDNSITLAAQNQIALNSSNIFLGGQVVAYSGILVTTPSTNEIGLADTNGLGHYEYLYTSTNSGTPTVYVHGSGTHALMDDTDKDTLQKLILLLLILVLILEILQVLHTRRTMGNHLKKHHQ